MASIRTEFEIQTDADRVWEVIGDWADGPVGMAHGHVVSSHADGDIRVVTFAKGSVARERLIARDQTARRIVYSLIGDTVCPEHDNTAMQIVPDGPGRCRFVWSRDVLPDELAGPLLTAMEEAAPIIRRTLESAHTAATAPGAGARRKPLAAQQRARRGLGGVERTGSTGDPGQDERPLDQRNDR
ncbi:SRPBCC family protein [Mycobacterium sp. 852002-51057_SCH5723018]|uniref:SRPBCC family protein n=1 Tax=Mycobacterium sp. 852002-51057_SCH5723018 TaxID=1834094 RepID=UPI0012E7C614|nr:SRPBCC family protein [Mycobacterium sp. 852002-51057_SCH5723018]